MRKQKDVLMSALRPFYFDPLLDWVAEGKHRKTDTGEVVNKKAVETLKSIENRLNGLVEYKKKIARTNINMPLSVAGQVQHLIKEATSHENLSQMYLGWASYL
jgi:phosphatidylinositol kinase/protein kinase (PI-3  family)